MDFFWSFEEGNSGLEGHVIQRQEFFSGGVLHDGSEEGHRVEEVAEAKCLGGKKLG